MTDKELLKILDKQDEENYYENGDNKKICNYGEVDDNGDIDWCMNDIKAPHRYCPKHRKGNE